ncbi:hypothetical protein [Pseudalkalibacillus sp. SCS-8]|uniref:hypothetical protein n=1 Tax=Pseudalkalibacillus nanhaiensis TaxID=3115291 RepID=UPI0032DB7C93
MKWTKARSYILLGIFGLILIIIRIRYASPYASTWDMVDFSLALDRFDLFMMQPHFPGYPYFILFAMFTHLWMSDPAQALSAVGAILITSALIPSYLILNKRLPESFALIGSLVPQSLTYIWVMSTQPMSEASAVGIFIWFLWGVDCAVRKPDKHGYVVFSSFLFSLLMGIRVSYFPLGIVLIPLWWKRWRQLKRKSIVWMDLLLFTFFQFLWVLGLILSTGGFGAFVELSISFINGHFQDWGGTALTSERSLVERLFQLVFNNLLWVGVLGKSFLSAILFIALIVLAGLNLGRMTQARWVATLLLLTYLLWAWIGQNIEKPRHILPLIPLLLFILLDSGLQGKRRTWNRLFILTLVPFMMLQSIQGILEVKRIQAERPASYQLIDYVENQAGPVAIYTWEEERVMDYLDAPFYYKKLYSYSKFKEEISQLDQHRILITDRVLKGFEKQGIDVSAHVTRVASFQSNGFVDPIYNQIKLYEWGRANTP